MDQPEITVVEPAERDRVMSVLVLGFSADPFLRWFYPQAEDYIKCAPAMDAFGGGAIDESAAYRSANFEGAALWYPPGFGPDEERLVAYFENTISSDILGEVLGVFEAMESYHPSEPCWYLPIIAVDPSCQGMGVGAALMKHSLQRVDSEGLPAYLESSNPRNISLYERHGFEVMGEIQIGTSPVITPMFRAAR